MILFMLDIKSNKRQIVKYLIMSIFFLLFALIYEIFSHGVFSSYMMCAFLIPLLMGCFIYGMIYYTKTNRYLSNSALIFYNTSILTFTLGSIMKGVLDIYGTTNQMIRIYSKLGISLIIISMIINLSYNIKEKRNVKIEKEMIK